MKERGVARFPTPIEGRIPNFDGSEEACKNISDLPAWADADRIKANPDFPQRTARYRALQAGKQVLMPTPKLKEGFLLLDGDQIRDEDHWEASTIKGSFRHGRKLDLFRLGRVDLIVSGSVAVDGSGGRLGKGGGYSDLEYAILRDLGSVDESTPVGTPVHPLQVVERVPTSPHDVCLDAYSTPSEFVETSRDVPRPEGVDWSLVSDDMLEEIPILAELRG